MGVINHDAVIATTWSEERFAAIQEWVSTQADDWRPNFIFGPVVVNSYRTLLLVPDGSKEGWEHSDVGNYVRAALIARIKEDDYEDGSNPWDYVEVSFGEYGARVSSTNCKNQYTDAAFYEET